MGCAVALVMLCAVGCDGGEPAVDDDGLVTTSSGGSGESDREYPTSSYPGGTLADEQVEEPAVIVSGVVTRTADIQEDGLGDLYVAIFDANPVDLLGTIEPNLVAQVKLEAQNLNAQDCQVGYALEGIAPRAEPYFVITYFDDNGSTTADDPSPDKGDLVSLSGLSAIEIVLDRVDSFEVDLVLNVVMPL